MALLWCGKIYYVDYTNYGVGPFFFFFGLANKSHTTSTSLLGHLPLFSANSSCDWNHFRYCAFVDHDVTLSPYLWSLNKHLM